MCVEFLSTSMAYSCSIDANDCGISGDNNFKASICINIGVWAKVLMYPNFISIHLKIILTFKPVLWEEEGIEVKAERYY